MQTVLLTGGVGDWGGVTVSDAVGVVDVAGVTQAMLAMQTVLLTGGVGGSGGVSDAAGVCWHMMWVTQAILVMPVVLLTGVGGSGGVSDAAGVVDMFCEQHRQC